MRLKVHLVSSGLAVQTEPGFGPSWRFTFPFESQSPLHGGGTAVRSQGGRGAVSQGSQTRAWHPRGENMLHTILQRPHCPRDPPSWACLWLVGKTSQLHHGWSVSPQAEDLRSKRWVKKAAGAKTAGNGLSSSIARSRAPGRSLNVRRQAGEGLKSRWELGALIIVPPSVAL